LIIFDPQPGEHLRFKLPTSLSWILFFDLSYQFLKAGSDVADDRNQSSRRRSSAHSIANSSSASALTR
jgi:hypothetical protein